jgi:hypothetical protein
MDRQRFFAAKSPIRIGVSLGVWAASVVGGIRNSVWCQGGRGIVKDGLASVPVKMVVQ